MFLTNLWHMFVYSGFPCLQFSRLCSPEKLSVFTNITVNTEGEMGINSQRTSQAHLVRAFSTSLKLLSPTPPLFPTLAERGEKPMVMKRILTVLISQRPPARTPVHFRENVPQLSQSGSQTCTSLVTCPDFDEAHGDAITTGTWIYKEIPTTASELWVPNCAFSIVIIKKSLITHF